MLPVVNVLFVTLAWLVRTARPLVATAAAKVVSKTTVRTIFFVGT
jgi:hypothetical protein